MRRGALASLAAIGGALALGGAWVAASGDPGGRSSAGVAQAGAALSAGRASRARASRAPRSPRRGSASAAYVVGGFARARRARQPLAERVDLRSGDRWRASRRCRIALNHAAAVADGGRLYVVGGYTRRARARRRERGAAALRPALADRWTRLRDDADAARRADRGRRSATGSYAAGGARGGAALTTVEIYDFALDSWRAGPPLRGGARAPRRRGRSAARFYVLAGRTPPPANNCTAAERFVPGLRRWETLPVARASARGGIARGDGRRARRARRRRGPDAGRAHDRRGRGVRPAHAALALPGRPANAAPRARRRRAGPLGLRARRRSDARTLRTQAAVERLSVGR